MPLNEILLIVLVILAAALLLLQVIMLLRGRGDPGLGIKLDALKDDSARVERTLREEQRAGREELQQGFDRFRSHLGEQLNGMSQQQAERIDGFGQRLTLLTERTDGGLQTLAQRLAEDGRKSREEAALTLGRFGEQQQQQFAALTGDNEKRMGEVRATLESRLTQLTERTDTGLQSLTQRLVDDARKGREEVTITLNRLGEQQQQRLAALTADNEKRMSEMRATLEAKLGAIQQDNAAKLEQMRATVDEKLHATLETRLGESFKLVSERLEAVQRGLGEMQNLAAGVGDLKRVLTNVKKRGIFGEVQLGALLEDMLTAEQYGSNVITVPGSNDRVEFAIRMPGQEEGEHVYLPIDAKFPVEDYQRLLDAQEASDAEGALAAGRALETRVREEAKRIHSKYVAPPHTTDFAVLYLPTEGLYAEVIRRPGLFENLQRDHRVTVAGPTTLSALLNSLQMGFRTLAIAKRSSEVWKILGAVKNEFGKFGVVLDKTRKQLDAARNSIDSAGVRTRAIERTLREVESLSSDASQLLLDDAPLASDDDGGDDE
ncbi:DNA recombination protein RmuC [Rhodanobacter sp. AS-Z3]|uniref:DNA recombination protein RmuC n=1 Tax=Rhodanobacter sp. AS-Z3 TaxID=3031330 RepID=UPI002479183F|nr:DNA recombination protein RmuC [Rhodanobacter sp. AS-Z3]WEN15203.1 DNA recombination protein RmuC [Rhodanobacter sp. AS-Z3]